jgi:hypothetical protein
LALGHTPCWSPLPCGPPEPSTHINKKKSGIRFNQRDPEGLPTHELGCAISATMSRWKFLRAQFPACGGSLLTIPLDLSTSEERPNGDQGFAETLRLHPCMDPLRATGRPRTPPSQTRITERHLSAPGGGTAWHGGSPCEPLLQGSALTLAEWRSGSVMGPSPIGRRIETSFWLFYRIYRHLNPLIPLRSLERAAEVTGACGRVPAPQAGAPLVVPRGERREESGG